MLTCNDCCSFSYSHWKKGHPLTLSTNEILRHLYKSKNTIEISEYRYKSCIILWKFKMKSYLVWAGMKYNSGFICRIIAGAYNILHWLVEEFSKFFPDFFPILIAILFRRNFFYFTCCILCWRENVRIWIISKVWNISQKFDLSLTYNI